MLIGVAVGAYSSIFVAAPILAVLKEREPKYQQLRARLEAKPGAERRLRPVPEAEPAAGAAASSGPSTAAVGTAAATTTTTKTQARRPPPKSRRKPPAKRKRR